MKTLLQRLKIVPISERSTGWMALEQQRRQGLRKKGQIIRALKGKPKMKKLKATVIAVVMFFGITGTSHAWNLTWQYTNGTVPHDGFRIYRKLPTETGYTLFREINDPAVRTFVDPDRTVGICYELSAYNSIGDSARIRGCAVNPDGSFGIFIIN